MSRQLPAHPRLDELEREARDLLEAHADGERPAIDRVRTSHPRFSARTDARLTLRGAQAVIAREYGFASWPKLQAHVESLLQRPVDPARSLMNAIRSDDVALTRQLLDGDPTLRARINDPIGPFDSPPLSSARSRAMMDALLAAGADLNGKSLWWAGGFGFTHIAPPELAEYAIELGAFVDIHAAARLGRLDRVRELVEQDPQLVHTRGGDGETPLHFAKTVEVASYLLDHGAEIDARDIDHESTPAQYMLDHRPEVARYLVERGCKIDILLASAVGAVDRVCEILDADPDCIKVRASSQFFPMVNPKAGGNIYFWTLGPNASPYQAAAKFGHADVLRLLLERSPAPAQLVAACWLHDEASVIAALEQDPGLPACLSPDERAEIAHAARNNDTEAVRLMLRAGIPADARGQHRGTPLHWAAYHGNFAMAEAVLALGPPLEDAENDFRSTPLGWATHGSEHGWYHTTGNYPAVVDALLVAGARLPENLSGTEAVREVLRRYAAKDKPS
jgi:ankyrin repeat protein